jgi:hypothetical protein
VIEIIIIRKKAEIRYIKPELSNNNIPKTAYSPPINEDMMSLGTVVDILEKDAEK